MKQGAARQRKLGLLTMLLLIFLLAACGKEGEKAEGLSGNAVDLTASDPVVSLEQVLSNAVRIYLDDCGKAIPEAAQGEDWTDAYEKAGARYGLLPEGWTREDLGRMATREEAVAILFRCLPREKLAAINEVSAIPDYSPVNRYWEEVLCLYRAGVLEGKTESGAFCPKDPVSQQELQMWINRLEEPEQRVPLSLAVPAACLPEGWEAVRAAPIEMEEKDPAEAATLGRVAAAALRIYDGYHGYSEKRMGSGAGYLKKAAEFGILPLALTAEDPNRPATRAEAAAVLRGSMPIAELPAINDCDDLPDYHAGDPYWYSVCQLFQAGVLDTDEFGTFRPEEDLTVGELTALVEALTEPEKRRTITLQTLPYEELTYGTSGGGLPLEAYRFGDGENVMLVTFAIHGFEDCFYQDGKMLVYTAELLAQALRENPGVVARGDWTVYVLPCLNPDGTYNGSSMYGAGRRTLYSLNAQGNAVQGNGIDMNRSFPWNFIPDHSARNFTGDRPLNAPEAKALAEFTQSVKGSGKNVCIDTHGWLQQLLVSGGYQGKLYRSLKASFPENDYTLLRRDLAFGYYTAWAAFELGYDACLFEFPYSFYDERSFQDSGLAERYVQAILKLLEEY